MSESAINHLFIGWCPTLSIQTDIPIDCIGCSTTDSAEFYGRIKREGYNPPKFYNHVGKIDVVPPDEYAGRAGYKSLELYSNLECFPSIFIEWLDKLDYDKVITYNVSTLKTILQGIIPGHSLLTEHEWIDLLVESGIKKPTEHPGLIDFLYKKHPLMSCDVIKEFYKTQHWII